MAISVNIYSNANNSTKTVTFDFVGEVMVASDIVTPNPCNQYYFKITTSAKQDDGSSYSLKMVRDLSELALNGNVQSRANTTDAYGNVKSMVIDYLFDAVNGHTADQYLSGCTEQRPMKFV